jgi:hypothetical protein
MERVGITSMGKDVFARIDHVDAKLERAQPKMLGKLIAAFTHIATLGLALRLSKI